MWTQGSVGNDSIASHRWSSPQLIEISGCEKSRDCESVNPPTGKQSLPQLLDRSYSLGWSKRKSNKEQEGVKKKRKRERKRLTLFLYCHVGSPRRVFIFPVCSNGFGATPQQCNDKDGAACLVSVQEIFHCFGVVSLPSSTIVISVLLENISWDGATADLFAAVKVNQIIEAHQSGTVLLDDWLKSGSGFSIHIFVVKLPTKMFGINSGTIQVFVGTA